MILYDDKNFGGSLRSSYALSSSESKKKGKQHDMFWFDELIFYYYIVEAGLKLVCYVYFIFLRYVNREVTKSWGSGLGWISHVIVVLNQKYNLPFKMSTVF
jgi:hypothetical protein